MRRFAQRSSPRPHGMTLIFRCLISGTGRSRQFTWRQACYGPAVGRTLRQAGGKRIAVRSRETAGAIRGLRRTARGKIIFAGRARRESGRGREVNRRGNDACGKDRNRRRRRDMAASSGGASHDAAKTVMMNGIAARGAGSVLGAANSARGGEGGGRRGCDEEAVQQKRIKRERDDRDAPCHRRLPEPPHRQSLYPLHSQSDPAKQEWSELEDSNVRPPHHERGALPGCATLRRAAGPLLRPHLAARFL